MNVQLVDHPNSTAPRRSTTVAFFAGLRCALVGNGAPGSRTWSSQEASNYRELHYFFDLGAKIGLKLA